MPEYINNNAFPVHLAGPDGKIIKVKSQQKVILSEFFERYRTRGFITLASEVSNSKPNTQKIQAKIKLVSKPEQKIIMPHVVHKNDNEQVLISQRRQKRIEEIVKARKIIQVRTKTNAPVKDANRVVGRASNSNATELLRSNLQNDVYPISNGVGVGILSFNRKSSLERLINSILSHTDLRRTTVFISDDCSDKPDLIEYLNKLSKNKNLIVIRNDKRLGVAGNTNRILRCLSRFAYGIILNDDVEVLKEGWDLFYKDNMIRSGMHHFIYRQSGVYSASPDQISTSIINNVNVNVVFDKPHGAIIAFSNEMLTKCGFFNEQYGLYGMEHVDWSMKAWELGLQNKGFYDVEGSTEYFKIHAEKSAVENRIDLLNKAKVIFKERTPTYYPASDMTKVDVISYVVPFRSIDRSEAIKTVINNIRSQRFPQIDIILVEQDEATRININELCPIEYYIATEHNRPFNKSKAFNLGVSKIRTKSVILHDADMIVQGDYTAKIYDTLKNGTGCHIGSAVLYADRDSSTIINSTELVTKDTNCDRVVKYYEGGSIACDTVAYWSCGGFNEDFWGYGCEDCDFYARLASNSKWIENRHCDLLHLWHGRVAGWDMHHDTNRTIENKLKSLPMAERIKKQHEQLKKLGYGKFLS